MPSFSIFSPESFMKEAIKEAKEAETKEEVPIGAVVVVNNTIIGRGHNIVESLNDCTAHAEMLAISSALEGMKSRKLQEATLYTTLEPCTMCYGAIELSGIRTVICGASDKKKGFRVFLKEGKKEKTNYIFGVLETECSILLTSFFRSLRK